MKKTKSPASGTSSGGKSWGKSRAGKGVALLWSQESPASVACVLTVMAWWPLRKITCGSSPSLKFTKCSVLPTDVPASKYFVSLL